ncbi:MAG TPA: TonB-dependent receptor [Candidatus Baltobacteraceae bacterium]|nr:TonB-dependent receptor [Candidatus Baltobacteraceae bacterium]
MSTLTRILAAIMTAALSVGPVSAATSPSVPVIVAQGASTATVQGTVKDDSGAPLAGAHIDLRGPSTYSANTDATGAFTISNVTPGVYVLAAQKPGYQTATETDFALLGGATQNVLVTLHAETFTSLRTIATVRAYGQATFNTSTASVNVVSGQAFVDEAQPQVNRILNQIPGVQNTLPTSSANGAVPGAVTVPNIRGGLSFETATLIDGHPLAVGDYGDYVTTFLNSFMLGSVEVIKGPGVMAPETNYAINGTVNFRTKDPTDTFTPDYTFGISTHGETYFNFGVSDTIGRLGFVVDLAGDDNPSALDGTSTYFQTYGNNGVANWNGTTGTNVSYNYTYIPSTSSTDPKLAGTTTALNHIYGLLACCYTYGANFDQTAELFKLRYKFSNATTATASYLGSQTYADQNENTGSEMIPSVFSPDEVGSIYYKTSSPTYSTAAATYTGSLAQGTSLLVPNAVYPDTAQEINNEPIFQAEIRTLLGQDTVLARYYHASIDRLIYEGNPNPSTPVVGFYQLYGVNPASSNSCAATTCPPTVFNGQTTELANFDWYNQWEEDRLNGLSLEYDHGYGDGNDVTLSVDQTNASSSAGSWSANYPGIVSGTDTYAPPSTPTQTPSVTNPLGTSQLFTTILLRNVYNISPNLTGTLALYDNLYQNTFPYECVTGAGALTSSCAINGSNARFTTNHNSHFDERIALEYRPKNNIAIRLSAGSSIAPPYLSLLSKVSTAITCSTSTGICSSAANNPNLLPETAFGYDLGADYRLKDNVTVISVDGYMTNLFNRFLAEEYTVGNCSSAGITCPGAEAGNPAYLVYQSLNTNLNNSRYEGIELSLKRVVPQGFGFEVDGAIQHSYAYNLPPGFYCVGLKAGVPCIPANYNVNLPIIAGENFTGNTFGTVYGAPGGVYANSSVGASGFSNTAIPYLQGNAEINWTSTSGIYAALGDTLYGKNNGYNLPPFGIAYATIRVPISKTISIQASGDNIFNAWTQVFPIVGGGIAYPLANGTLGATIGNTVGPATYRFQLTKTLP